MCTHSRRPMHVMDVIHSVVSQKSCWHSVTNGLLFTVCPSLFYLTETRNSWESCVSWRTSSNPHDPCPPTRKRVMWSTTQNTNVWVKNQISTQIKSYMDRSDPRNSVRIQRLGWHRVIVRHLTVPIRKCHNRKYSKMFGKCSEWITSWKVILWKMYGKSKSLQLTYRKMILRSWVISLCNS